MDEAATGPFAQFQNSSDDEDALTGLVLQLIQRHPQAAPREEAVRLQVQQFRKSTAEMLKERKKDGTPAPKPPDETSVAKFFEEIKVLVRDMPERVASEMGGHRGFRGRKRFRFHPGMLEEFMYHPGLADGNPTLPILVAFSLVRDDFPWLYELATQFSRAYERGDHKKVHVAARSIINALEMVRHGPMSETFGRDDESMMWLHHLERMVDRHLHEMGTVLKPPTRKSVATKAKESEA
ncbi:MAG: hypothetical protein SFV51_27365 [Bryobacteraceae bacterium]|nr:hypothetical protein [Bryobacteraceae bacterium]